MLAGALSTVSADQMSRKGAMATQLAVTHFLPTPAPLSRERHKQCLHSGERQMRSPDSFLSGYFRAIPKVSLLEFSLCLIPNFLYLSLETGSSKEFLYGICGVVIKGLEQVGDSWDAGEGRDGA